MFPKPTADPIAARMNILRLVKPPRACCSGDAPDGWACVDIGLLCSLPQRLDPQRPQRPDPAATSLHPMDSSRGTLRSERSTRSTSPWGARPVSYTHLTLPTI